MQGSMEEKMRPSQANSKSQEYEYQKLTQVCKKEQGLTELENADKMLEVEII